MIHGMGPVPEPNHGPEAVSKGGIPTELKFPEHSKPSQVNLGGVATKLSPSLINNALREGVQRASS